MITVDIPRAPEDAEFLVDCACDHTMEHLRNSSLLPPGSLLSEDMLTLVIRKGKRLIGAVSSISGIDSSPEGNGFRTEIDVRYFHPKWRTKKYTKHLFKTLSESSPSPLFLRAPVSESDKEAAEELNIDYAVEPPADMKTITEMVLGNIDCVDRTQVPCPMCVRSTLREHFTSQCARMIVKAHQHQGNTT